MNPQTIYVPVDQVDIGKGFYIGKQYYVRVRCGSNANGVHVLRVDANEVIEMLPTTMVVKQTVDETLIVRA